MSHVSSEEEQVEKRWDPIGAPNENCDNILQTTVHDKRDTLTLLEKDKEVLSSSLFALTSHFAQVQLRLRQVMHASPESRDNLLESLEDFACRGIPDIGISKERRDETTLMTEICLRRQQQKEVLSVLKKQLLELKKYAFQNKDAYCNENMIFQRHKIIMNELKTKLNLNINDEKLVFMDPETISKEITYAVDQLIGPVSVKEHLVCQLKAQIADLEKFIEYLQNNIKSGTCKYHKNHGLIHKVLNIFEIFATVQLCAFNFSLSEPSNNIKCTEEFTEMQTKLERCILRIIQIVQTHEKHGRCRRKIPYNHALTRLVRKTFSTLLRNLIEHGTCSSTKLILVPFTMCCLNRNLSSNNVMHSWEIILKYYKFEKKESSNSHMNATNLFQSFNLDSTTRIANSPIHEMLWCIESIISTHEPYKKDNNCQFKAFICSALNSGKLDSWLDLIFNNEQLVNECYQPWSYVAITGFKDSLQILNCLSKYRFDLPVDKAVRHFQNIKDVFY